MSLAPDLKQRKRPAAKVIASLVVLLATGLLLPAAVLYARNSGAPEQRTNQQVPLAAAPSYASQLGPLLSYLHGAPAEDTALLGPLLAQQLVRSRSVAVEEARAMYSHALNRLAWPGTHTPFPASARLWRRPTEEGVLLHFVDAAFSALAREAHGRLINCSQDPTLPHTGAAVGRVALLSNLRQAGGVAPNMVLQLLRTILWLPPGAAYVGVYEDGSSDDTRRWLGLLQLMLVPLGVTHRVTLNGTLTRRPGEHRIAHLSRLRNQLVEPLFQDQQQGWSGTSSSGISSGSTSTSTSTSSTAVNGDVQFSPDQVIFINDVFWCRDDAARLLLHDADLACGYDVHFPGRRRRRWRALRRRQLLGTVVDSEETESAPTQSPKPKDFWFYDIWVGRDVTGARLMSGGPPFTKHPPSRTRALSGLPFPIYCGWNGAAKITAEAFRRGLRFRPHMPGECDASECSLLCDDMARLGLRRVLLDPAVAVAYHQEPKAALYAAPGHWTAVTGIAVRSWRDVSSAPPLDWSSPHWSVNYSAVECCGLDEGRDLVDWDKGCHPQDTLGTNFTAAWLQQQQHLRPKDQG